MNPISTPSCLSCAHYVPTKGGADVGGLVGVCGRSLGTTKPDQSDDITPPLLLRNGVKKKKGGWQPAKPQPTPNRRETPMTDMKLRSNRASTERQIAKAIWKMENDPMADLARLSERVDGWRIKAASLTATIEANSQQAERRALRKELMAG